MPRKHAAPGAHERGEALRAAIAAALEGNGGRMPTPILRARVAMETGEPQDEIERCWPISTLRGRSRRSTVATGGAGRACGGPSSSWASASQPSGQRGYPSPASRVRRDRNGRFVATASPVLTLAEMRGDAGMV